MRYRIKTNGEKFTPEEVLKQKNFEGFLRAYKKHALLNTAGKIGFGIIATGVIAAVILLSVKTNTTMNPEQQVTEKKVNYVEPPFKGFDTPCETFVIDASKGGELKYKSGSVLRVPPNAFLGKDGKPVSGNVTVRYREFHDPADIILSGIPMTYDSAGVQYHFESAGMMELLAFQGNNDLRANPNAKIHVNLASKQTGDYFNVYYLDTNKRNWDFVQRDTAGVKTSDVLRQLNDLLKNKTPEQVNKQLKKDLFDLDNKTVDIQKTNPVSPLLAVKDRYKFKLDVKAEEFPEMSAYGSVTFQVAPEELNFKPEYSKVVWDNVSVERFADKNGYAVTFSKGKEKHTFLCRPVVEAKDYANAKNIFEKMHKKYQELLADHKKKIKEKQQQLELVNKMLKNKNSNLNDSMSTAGMMNEGMYAMTQTIMRGFEVSKFGFWNCDCPTSLPKELMVNAAFVDSTGKPVKFDKVYLVEKGKNAVYTYYSYALSQFRYNPGKQNMIWAIAPGNKLAYFPVEAFRKLKVNKQYTEFEVKLVEKEFKSTDEVKKFMKI